MTHSGLEEEAEDDEMDNEMEGNLNIESFDKVVGGKAGICGLTFVRRSGRFIRQESISVVDKASQRLASKDQLEESSSPASTQGGWHSVLDATFMPFV